MRAALIAALIVSGGVAGAAPPSTDAYGWVPANAVSLAHFRGEGMFMLKFLDSHMADGMVAPCYVELRKKVTGYAQASFPGLQTGVFVWEGDATREEVESCSKAIVERIYGAPHELRRDGQLSIFAGKHPFALGFARGRVVQHDSTDVVSAVTQAILHADKTATNVATFLRKVDERATVWITVPNDLTGPFVGVSTRGGFMSATLPAKITPETAQEWAHTLRFTFVCADGAAAKKLVDRFDHPGLEPRFADIEKALHGVAHARGPEVDIDASVLMTLTSLPNAQELLQALGDKMKAAAQKR